MAIFSGVGSPGTINSASGGKLTASNSIGTIGAQVLAANPSRVKVTFHNPGTNNIFVYPTINVAGGSNTPSNASPGGAFQIFPGSLLTIDGECQTAWGAFSNTGSSNPLTIMESNI